MNQQQRKHAVARVESIRRQKLADIEERDRIPAKGVTQAELVRLVKNGKLKPRCPDEEIGQYESVRAVFDYKPFGSLETYKAGYKGARRKVKDRAARVADKVMLGDGEQALALIEAFDREPLPKS